jgi:hypothetical protein
MVGRTLCVTLLVLAVLSCAAPGVLAYEATDSYAVDQHARLVDGTSQVAYAWSEPGAIKAARIVAGSVLGPYTLVTGVTALGDWCASGDGQNVTVIWKDASSVWATRVDLATGAAAYASTLLCSDAQAVALRGAGTTVTPSGVVADGQGGAYVWCTLDPASSAPGVGDSLVNHVSAAGALAQAAPGQPAANGTVAAMAAVGDGDVLALLQPPGRSRVAARRYGTDLSTRWTRSPYLFDPSTVSSSEAITVIGGADAAVAWREGATVKVQRFAEDGAVKFLSPPAVAMPRVGGGESVKIAGDGSGGFYVVGPSGDGISARHVLVSGLQASWDPSVLTGLGLSRPHVDALAGNRAGDLFAAYSDDASTADPGVALLTYAGPWSDVGPASAPERYAGAVPDGSGGAWVMGDGNDARLWHIANAASQLTCRPRVRIVQYPKSVTLSGYATAAGGSAIGGATVRVGTLDGDRFSSRVVTTTRADGFYSATVKPAANARWTARGDVFADLAAVQVAPRVTMSMSHLRASTRLGETFSGSVSPDHGGKKVQVQKAAGRSWKTVATGRLDSRSRYRVTWYVPYRTATYKLRTIVPAHADHAQGASPSGTLKVVVKKG